MDVFSSPAFDDHEQVIFFYDRASGLKAIVALHDTTLGPAVGGCRMWPYASEAEALTDVLRLSRGMTFKAAMAELPYGGGKTVIIGDSRKDKSEALFRALGRAIDSLGGRYYTGEDVGTSPTDMDWAGEETAYVLGCNEGGSGDPSPVTARGVWLGIRAAVRHKLGQHDLAGVRVAIQGLGHVGYNLARLLAQDGARLSVADLDGARVERAADEFAAKPLDVDAILFAECDVLAPCALGGVINDPTIPKLVLSDRGRRGEQSAARGPARRGAACARHPLRPRLRDQRRRADQHRPGAATRRLRPRAGAREGGGDRNDARRGVRAVEAGGSADP